MAGKLSALLGDRSTGALHESGAGALPEWVHRLIAAGPDEVLGAAARVGELVAFSYEPDIGCFFNGDDPVALAQQVPELLTFHIEPRDPWSSLSELDPFACNLRLQGIAVGTRELFQMSSASYGIRCASSRYLQQPCRDEDQGPIPKMRPHWCGFSLKSKR